MFHLFAIPCWGFFVNLKEKDIAVAIYVGKAA